MSRYGCSKMIKMPIKITLDGIRFLMRGKIKKSTKETVKEGKIE